MSRKTGRAIVGDTMMQVPSEGEREETRWKRKCPVLSKKGLAKPWEGLSVEVC